MFVDIHNKYLELTLITYEDIQKVKWLIFFSTAQYDNDHYMKKLLKCLENMFPSMNYDSGHPQPADRPNFDLSKIAKIPKNRDFPQKFDFLYKVK